MGEGVVVGGGGEEAEEEGEEEEGGGVGGEVGEGLILQTLGKTLRTPPQKEPWRALKILQASQTSGKLNIVSWY